MKKYLPTLIVACAIYVASAPALQAQTLQQKIQTAKTQLKADTQKINVNTADASQLQALPGIGAKKAAQIVAYREQNGQFSTLQDLTNVKGIGTRMVEKLQDAASVK
ncbi:ComEA family DNA-binding protein [Aliiglaciecola sp. LCG003]|uniref:ComEA family DNA-binding protein n=1 Tax=Aliiglaciecola sp. LCG003 TaxID=3053655 RepID=UPI002573E2BC|nr:ComEA family DNA-binding protein [Aliiglaciecola sp. LCG003]WJG10413.1 ComEA family DNA-binding protein [Aliiglaciecola sp. LCG003]